MIASYLSLWLCVDTNVAVSAAAATTDDSNNSSMMARA